MHTTCGGVLRRAIKKLWEGHPRAGDRTKSTADHEEITKRDSKSVSERKGRNKWDYNEGELGTLCNGKCEERIRSRAFHRSARQRVLKTVHTREKVGSK